MPENRKLTIKQQKFADEYIITGNATEAAIKAGYSENSASETGYENLRKPHIKKYIDERLESIKKASIATIEEVREFWTSVLRNNDGDMKDRLKASEFIAKTEGAFIEKIDLDVDSQVVIIDDLD